MGTHLRAREHREWAMCRILIIYVVHLQLSGLAIYSEEDSSLQQTDKVNKCAVIFTKKMTTVMYDLLFNSRRLSCSIWLCKKKKTFM